MPLFEVVIMKKPLRKEKEEDGAMEELILPVTTVIARNGQAAAMQITVEKADLFKGQDMSRFEVLVRPFQ